MVREGFYGLSIRYFILYMIALLGSGIMLFFVESGLLVSHQTFTIPLKSIEGIMEIAVPHLFGMGMLLFVLIHFLLMLKTSMYKGSKSLFIFSVIVIFLDQSSYLMMWTGVEILGWFKVMFVFMLSVLFGMIGWRVVRS